MSQDDTLERFDVTRRRLVQSLGLTGIAGLAGCAGGGGNGNGNGNGGNQTPTPKDQTPTPAKAENAKMGGKLIATFGADVKNTDPTQINDTTSSKATGLIYEGLMSTDFSGKPQPHLAKSVEKADQDGLKWKFQLREGVKFNGDDFSREVTSEDVKVSFERYKGTTREADVYQWYDSMEIQDDHNFTVQLKEKYAPFKFSVGVPIVPKEVEEDGSGIDLTKKPVGTGPYKFVEHQPDSLWRIERNEDYWFQGDGKSMPKKSPIKEITFRIIVETSAQLAALKAGNVDFINDVQPESYKDLKSNKKFTVTERTEGGFDMFIFPLGTPPFDNKNIRRGISRLIPRQAIVESVYKGIGFPAYAPISPLAQQFTSKQFNEKMGQQYTAHNPDKAKQLLDKGFEEAGISKPFKTKIITNENPQRVKWCQLIQESLNQSGYFEVGLEQFEWNTYTGKILAKDSHKLDSMVALGWSAGWDPDAYVNYLFHSDKATPTCCNVNHYSKQKVDKLIEDGLKTYKIAERKKIYKELQEIIVDETPMAFIRFGKAIDAFKANTVMGFQTYPIDGDEYASIYAPYAEQFTWVDKGQ